jgi:hypothetical protein
MAQPEAPGVVEAIQLITKTFHYKPAYNEVQLYRYLQFSNPHEISKLLQEVQAGAEIQLAPGQRKIQSWTDSLEVAIEFGTNYSPIHGVVVSAPFWKDEILVDLPNLGGVLRSQLGKVSISQTVLYDAIENLLIELGAKETECEIIVNCGPKTVHEVWVSRIPNADMEVLEESEDGWVRLANQEL